MTASEHIVRLPADLASVATARRFVRRVLADAGLDELADDGQLATSELVANAVRHAGTGAVLRVDIDAEVRIAVEDGHPELRQPVPAGDLEHAESGRGLRIVAAVSSDWGVSVSSAGKVVWFTLARPDLHSPDAEVRGITSRAPGAAAPAGSPASSNGDTADRARASS